MFATDDTIVAISTPPGRGGIGIVRLSGPDATRIAVELLQPDAPLEPRQATFGRVHDPATGERIDQAVTTWFPSPHSYTGDDVVEISGHGSPVVLGAILKAAVDCGARPAEPGEFTLRAYLNGRIDLAQAEAVADLVDAVTPLQARAALDQLEGTLTGAIRRIDAALFDLCARLEASLDFPDEGFHFISRPETIAESARLTQELDGLLEDGRAGRVIREGRTVVILGRPNAGKSSLFNALAGAARAIVTEIPGTTRDLITERIDVNGLALTLVDTAGLRIARDAIEAEGVRRAQQAQQVAALSLIVVDGSETLEADERELVKTAMPPAVVVQSKADLPQRWTAADLGPDRPDVIEVSSVTNAGLAELRAAMVRALLDREERRDPPMITNIRHLALVEAARDSIVRAHDALESGSTEELILADLTQARQHLEEIAGRRTAEDLLQHIFTRFCIGK